MSNKSSKSSKSSKTSKSEKVSKVKKLDKTTREELSTSSLFVNTRAHPINTFAFLNNESDVDTNSDSDKLSEYSIEADDYFDKNLEVAYINDKKNYHQTGGDAKDKYVLGDYERNQTRHIDEESKLTIKPITFLENIYVPISQEIILDKEVDISKLDIDLQTDKSVDYPEFSLGFYHWIHASKSKTEQFNQFQGKKKVYQVVNGYERYIDDYNQGIGNVSEKYFDLNVKGKPNILSRAFYKLWEILYYYDVIDVKKTKFRSAHLAEGPGSFIQSVMFFRELYANDYKNDTYFAITIHSENEDDGQLEGKNVQDLGKEFIDYYSKEKPQRFQMHKTYTKVQAGGAVDKDNGDLTTTKTINLFKQDVISKGDKVDLVTGDGGFDWTNENIQEQECIKLIYGQILTALNIQKQGGHFILKVFETFTKVSCKFIILLKYFYDEVHIVKPLTSRESNSEKYLVCKNFKYEEKQFAPFLKRLMDTLDAFNASNEYMIDIFPKYDLTSDVVNNMIAINNAVANQQFKAINMMIEFIEGSNYHGELYQRYKSRQIALSEYWISVFFPNEKDYKKASAKAAELIVKSNKSQKAQVEIFDKTLVINKNIASKVKGSKMGRAKVSSKNKEK